MKMTLIALLVFSTINAQAGFLKCAFSEPEDVKTTTGNCYRKAIGENEEPVTSVRMVKTKGLQAGVTSNEYMMFLVCPKMSVEEIIANPLKGKLTSGSFGHGFFNAFMVNPDNKKCFATGIQAMSIHVQASDIEIYFGE